MAFTMSVDLSITITAAVPRPLTRRAGVEIHQHVVADDFGITGTEAPPGYRQQVVPAATHPTGDCSINSRSGMPSSSSTLHGLFTWPEMQKTFGPEFFGRPSE